MDLVRDVLDKRVLDRNGRDMGRVDGIVVLISGDGQPRVTAFELGPSVLAYRIRPLFGRWVAGLEHALGIDEGRPLRIPLDDVLDVDDHVKVDRAFGETSAATIEQRLRRWIAAIPGAA
jgi:sporulation protein YlmC with PRC-barrel domain